MNTSTHGLRDSLPAASAGLTPRRTGGTLLPRALTAGALLSSSEAGSPERTGVSPLCLRTGAPGSSVGSEGMRTGPQRPDGGTSPVEVAGDVGCGQQRAVTARMRAPRPAAGARRDRRATGRSLRALCWGGSGEPSCRQSGASRETSGETECEMVSMCAKLRRGRPPSPVRLLA